MLFEDEPDDVKRENRPTTKTKLPPVPDLSGTLDPQRRPSPFLMDDWGGSSSANTTKP